MVLAPLLLKQAQAPLLLDLTIVSIKVRRLDALHCDIGGLLLLVLLLPSLLLLVVMVAVMVTVTEVTAAGTSGCRTDPCWGRAIAALMSLGGSSPAVAAVAPGSSRATYHRRAGGSPVGYQSGIWEPSLSSFFPMTG